MTDHTVETQVPCPACEGCPVCGDNRDEPCASCAACGLCLGTRLVFQKERRQWLAENAT